jgi:hypothetical protein
MQEPSQENAVEKKELTPLEQAKLEVDYAKNADKAMNTIRTVFLNYTIPVGMCNDCLVAFQILDQLEQATRQRLKDVEKRYDELKELTDVSKK